MKKVWGDKDDAPGTQEGGTALASDRVFRYTKDKKTRKNGRAEYGIIHCTVEQLSELDKEVIKYKKETPYGAEAIVPREDAPDGFKLSPISIEELFVFMVKEAK